MAQARGRRNFRVFHAPGAAASPSLKAKSNQHFAKGPTRRRSDGGNRITLPERSILQRISRLVVPTTVPWRRSAEEAVMAHKFDAITRRERLVAHLMSPF